MKKLQPLPHLKKILEAKKHQGKKIVLANGCFDLIHVGHIRYLKESKKRGDILVVALNSDSSIRQLKGGGRPILEEEDRVEIISSFYFVDYVTIFNEKTVEKILLALKPDFQAKGSDYTQESVPERETVASYGGKIVITGGAKVRSTSQLIRKIAARIKKSN